MLLRAVVLTLLIASIFILWRAFQDPTLPPIQALDSGNSASRAASSVQFTLPLAEFAAITQLQLGAPLHDPPEPEEDVEPEIPDEEPFEEPEMAEEEDPEPPGMGLRVIGTVLEAGRSMAIVADEDGGLQVKGEGEKIETEIGTGEIERIEYDQITILLDGEKQTLTMP